MSSALIISRSRWGGSREWRRWRARRVVEGKDSWLWISRCRRVVVEHPRNIIMSGGYIITYYYYHHFVTVFTFANNFNGLICIVEYIGACPSSDFPRGGPTGRLLFLFRVNFLCGILGVNFFLSAPLFSSFSLLSLDIKVGSLICLYLHLSHKGHLFTWNRKQIGVVVFDSMEWILTVLLMGAAPAEASSLVRTLSRGNCCSWQFKAVTRNASLRSFEISPYNIANLFLSGIVLSFVSFALSINNIRLCTANWKCFVGSILKSLTLSMAMSIFLYAVSNMWLLVKAHKFIPHDVAVATGHKYWISFAMHMVIARYSLLMSWRYKYSSSLLNVSSSPLSFVM